MASKRLYQVPLFSLLKDWPVREHLQVGEKNIISEALVSREMIIFPPLHIKLGLMKQFVKALSKEGECFRYLRSSFVGLSEVKLKDGVFDGSQIRQLINDEDFIYSMSEPEACAWRAFVGIVRNFLGNRKAENHEE